MEKLMLKVMETHQSVNRSSGTTANSEYLVISDFGTSSVASEGGCLFPHFRIFTPVKPQKGRKLNSCYMDAGTPFNAFRDTLMDYPTIVRHKLCGSDNGPWQNFNKLISVHVSRCPLNCWHCYLEECLKYNCASCSIKDTCNHKLKAQFGIKESWFTAKRIVDTFLQQRQSDPENKSNIIRITGGEPFLVPNLILEILKELKSRRLEKDVFLWTETSLVPLINQDGFSPVVTDEQLQELSQFKNFCIHPCFHGLSEASFQSITGNTLISFNHLLEALKRLIKAGIDVYPTFGSNMCSPHEVRQFFEGIFSINESLPLRFCLIEYDLDYKPIKWRQENIAGFAKSHEIVFDRFQVIGVWDQLLKDKTHHSYAEIPRHLVSL